MAARGTGVRLQGEVLHVALRAFELLLLREIGLLPLLDAQTTDAGAPASRDGRYCLVPEGGLRQAHDDDRASLSGAQWTSLQAALGDAAAFTAVLRACGPVMAELQAPTAHAAALPLRGQHPAHPADDDRPAEPVNPARMPCISKHPRSASMKTALSVNLNKVALVRNTRHLGIPSVTRAATLCLQAGAHGITVHPRPDERHIRAQDVVDLAELLQDWPDREFNIEGNPFHNLMDFVRRGAARTRSPSCPTAKASSPATTAGAFPHDAERLQPLIDEGQALGAARQPVHGPGARADGAGPGRGRRPGRALHRALCRRLGHAGAGRAVAALCGGRAGRAGCRPGRQRRPRPEPRQPHRLSCAPCRAWPRCPSATR